MMYLRTLALVPILLATADLATAEPTTRTISGQLTYMQRIALTPDSIAVVEFRTDDDQMLDETRFRSEGRQVPLPFSLQVPTETSGQVRGAIWSAGRPAWMSNPVVVAATADAGAAPVEIGMLRLRPFEPSRFNARMRCGDTEVEIEIGLADDHVRMRIEGETIDLFTVPAASGAKFAAKNDPDTYFWSKGNSASVGLGGDTLPECVAAVPVEKTPFTARGNEPGWMLKISGDRLRLTLDYGAREVEAALPAPVITDRTTVYQLPEQGINLRIREDRCSDTMTGMPYPNSVVLEFEGQRLNGCGGEPRALLEGPEWTVNSLAGDPLPDEVSVSINFLEDDRVAGSSGCNRFMGGYELTGEGLSFGQIAGTMMACPEPQMKTEQHFLELLRGVTRFEITPDGGLLLITSDDERISAKR